MDSSFAKPRNGITVALEVRCEDVFSCGCADKGSFRGQLRRSSVFEDIVRSFLKDEGLMTRLRRLSAVTTRWQCV